MSTGIRAVAVNPNNISVNTYYRKTILINDKSPLQ